MNLYKSTMNKLEHYQQELEDFEAIYQRRSDTFSREERKFFSSKVSSIKQSIKYYSEILKILE